MRTNLVWASLIFCAGCTAISGFGRFHSAEDAGPGADGGPGMDGGPPGPDAGRDGGDSDGGPRTCDPECPTGETCVDGTCMCGTTAACTSTQACCAGTCTQID